ncbi:hypothetical protein O181_043874 [Austropuccinia psidii MF-1]|uniref:Uncharacterized protein n=1 Tax=Austropuccinia psidii MF-1 TaxID=1389203 RepID=A0A9Q3HIV8_9BASI|nr:hypothetical protein [Austropuccinia psidii MF-1]
MQRPGLFSFPFSRNSYTKENQKQRIHIEQSNEEEDGSEDGYSSPIQLKSVSNPIYQMKSSKGKEWETEPEDPEHQVSNYQDGIVAESSVASTRRVKIQAKNDNLGPKTIADYSRHKGWTNLSKNYKGKFKSTSKELATDNYLHESLFSDSDGI